jgi:pyruvate-ferredoxin/flavodoxin oxidoreductase
MLMPSSGNKKITDTYFLDFFDGFRTSHEVNQIEMLPEDDMRALIDRDRIFAHITFATTSRRVTLTGETHSGG